jgi:hypothetical protein
MRWEKIWKQRMKKISLAKGILDIFHLGINGTSRHFRGVVGIGLRRIKSLRERIWKKVVLKFQESMV